MSLEDYKQKIENLPLDRLKNLAIQYGKTIRQLEIQRKEARYSANMRTVEYTDEQLAKKREELALIEAILENKPE